jgi:predicted dehydrogenase
VKKVKVGVVGVGHLGRFHTMNYAQIPEAELIGVYDADSDRAKKIASEFECQAFETMEPLLDHVDAVSIAVPTDKHFEIGMPILERGIHSLVEKPIAQNLKEADALIQKADEKKCILQIGHVERFNPAMCALDHVEKAPRFIEAHRLAPFVPRGIEVSVIHDLMIHDIEIILELIKSPVKSIDASGVAVVTDSIDIGNARIRFENGSVANLTASRISQIKMRKMRLFQKDEYITVDFLNRVAEVYRLNNDPTEEEEQIGEIGVGDRKQIITCYRPPVSEELGLKIELENFISTILGENPVAVTGRMGRDALNVALQIVRQMES